MLESLGESFTSLNTFLVVQFLDIWTLNWHHCFSCWLEHLLDIHPPASFTVGYQQPPAEEQCRQQGMHRKKCLQLFQQNLPENICLGPCAALCFKWDNILSAGGTEELCNGFWHLTVRYFHLFLRHPLHLFIFSGGTRELAGKEEMQVVPAGTASLQDGSIWLRLMDLSSIKCTHSGHP